ncbi:esterase-like activity of phytase family protein [Belnapia sp. T6]|uniref:Esterase-like activity of phytase family protein n=1 Tax=Belnapia mucosa TaxID=2804532 RepID=A0ABS1V2S8_9PROT|nr:esterase-like activity of phytase family protein [Belnapia mucosa]MBL6455421.1 esterase-like activity of phytase family protein [Belnapia mucosa]
MPRLSRRALLAALATSGCVPGGAGQAQGAVARPLALDPLPPGSRLEALGGLVLDDAVLGFGGLSGIWIDNDLQLTAVSDVAHWLTARLVLRDGRPAALTELRTGLLKDGSGQPLRRGFGGDAESLARLPNGTFLVGFERWHRIRAFRPISGPGAYVEAPPRLELAQRNGGLESLAVLPDGRWLAIAEQLRTHQGPQYRQAWIGGPGRWRPFAYGPGEGYDPADCAALPDGGALVLERSFSIFGGFTGRLVRLSAAQLRAAEGDVALVGDEILTLSGPIPRDNYEGVAVFQHGGRTLVALISDDNENMLQRTLLLLFALQDD